ncbi:MAG TPA: hypothetical protein VFA20_31245 [Myxococcaceae bacterium]|nr:hypothetical protein [Myxococcaceae bacterium]
MDTSTARVRFWVVAPASASPAGRRFTVNDDRFAAELAAVTNQVSVTIPDKLGPGPTRSFTIGFGKLRGFQVSALPSAVSLLGSLKSIAESPGSPEAAAAKVKELCGDGPLAAALAAVAQDPAPAPKDKDAPLTAEDLQLKSAAASAIDSFLRSTRAAGAASPSAPSGDRVARLRAVLQAAVDGTARDLLATPPLSRIESTWRGLRLLTEQCPAAARILVEVIDAGPSAAVELLEKEMPEEAFDRPEAVFIASPVADAEVARKLAELGESYNVPVVVDLDPAVALGAGGLKADLDAVPPPPVPEAWAAFRGEESSRWLFAAVNPVALLQEAGHTCLGSPSMGIAAMLAQSFATTDGFGRVIGPGGALQAPATLPQEGGAPAPTEIFVSAARQSALAGRGLLAVGSVRGKDQLALTSAASARATAEATPLPGQIVTGRLVRFSQWVRDQIPPTATEKDVESMFGEAAQVFLFAGASGAGRVEAELLPGEPRRIMVRAALPASHAGTPFQIAFELPLRA